MNGSQGIVDVLLSHPKAEFEEIGTDAAWRWRCTGCNSTVMDQRGSETPIPPGVSPVEFLLAAHQADAIRALGLSRGHGCVT